MNTDFTSVVNRMRWSQDEHERDSWFLGRMLFGDNPVLLDKSLNYGHGNIRGMTQSGKTAAILRILLQVMARLQVDRANDPLAHKDDRRSILVVDLKGTAGFFHGCWSLAEHFGYNFKFLTSRPGDSSYIFSPLDTEAFQGLSSSSAGQVLLDSFGLNHGQGFGESFFTAIDETVLLKTIKTFAGNIRTISDIAGFLADKSIWERMDLLEEWKTARHLAAVVNRMAAIQQLQLTEEDLVKQPGVWTSRMDPAELFHDTVPALHYLHLPVGENSLVSPSVAMLYLFLSFVAASRLPRHKRRDVLVVMDEFQFLVNASITTLLEQAAGLGVSLILAHQTRAQLKNAGGRDITEHVESNVRYLLDFQFSHNDGIDFWAKQAPQARFASLSWLQFADSIIDHDADHSFSPNEARDGYVTVSETKGPLWGVNELQRWSAHPRIAMARFNSLSGHSVYPHPFPFLWEHGFPLEFAKLLERNDWPLDHPGTIILNPKWQPTIRKPTISADLEARIRAAMPSLVPPRRRER